MAGKLRFAPLPDDRKAQMLKLIDGWKRHSGNPDTLLEGLAVLAEPGRVRKLQALAIFDPHGLRVFIVDYARGGYGERGVVEMADAINLLELVRRHRRNMPLPQHNDELFATSLELVARVLFKGEVLDRISGTVPAAIPLAASTLREIDMTLATGSLL